MSLGVIDADPSVAMAWLTGSKLNSTQTRQEVENVVNELERAVAFHG